MSPLHLPHRNCGLLRWTALATVLPPLLFGPVHALAVLALALLAAVALLWTGGVRRAARRAPQLHRSTAALAFDAMTLMTATGVLLACLSAPESTDTVGPGTLALALGCLALALLHRFAHPRRR
jgi:hypothetical protein